MAINVTVIRKKTGDLVATGFQNEAQMVEMFLKLCHFDDPGNQLKWLEELRDTILPGVIIDFKDDFDLGERKCMYCHECSKAGGAERAIYHTGPACKAEE
jgi:hypothetical protein